jgi:hypothetical protein
VLQYQDLYPEDGDNIFLRTLATKLHDVTPQKTTISNFTAMKTSSITSRCSCQFVQNDETALPECVKL